MDNAEELARLAGAVATRLSRVLTEDPVGLVPSPNLSALLDALELFVPQMLRQDFQEWEVESLDGFLVAEANVTVDASLTLAGLAILISDQTVTPCRVALQPATDGSLERTEVLLGERGGGGVLGISGPICTAASVPSLLDNLIPRLSHVDWVYRATYIQPDPRHARPEAEY